MRFWKYHGAGNDFILVEDFEGTLLGEAAALTLEICHRNFGVGGDGLVLLTHTDEVFTMRIFNTDGSEAEMCGNAVRCVAHHLFAEGHASGETIRINTISGSKEVQREGGLYAVDMGEPQFVHKEQLPAGIQEVEALDATWQIYPVSMGNPHGVVFVEDLDTVPFEQIGPLLEKHSIWPAQANIEFVQVENISSIKVKVWERGVGPTLACGTGACAAAVWSARLGKTDRTAAVTLPGGSLQIRWADDNHVWMIGPAVKVFAGKYCRR